MCVCVFDSCKPLRELSTPLRLWFSLSAFPLLSVALLSWSKVHSPSSSSPQSTLQNINTWQWRSPQWITAAVRLINGFEDKASFIIPKVKKSYLSSPPVDKWLWIRSSMTLGVYSSSSAPDSLLQTPDSSEQLSSWAADAILTRFRCNGFRLLI